MFKVNTKNNRTTSSASFINDFEQIDVTWVEVITHRCIRADYFNSCSNSILKVCCLNGKLPNEHK